MITLANNTLSVHFEAFNLGNYDLFLKCKKLPEYALEFDTETDSYTITAPARFASILGVETAEAAGEDLPMAPHLFDYQAFIVQTALAAKRYAVWADCGLGKTAMFLEFARQIIARTRGRVLILSPLAIIPQTIEESNRFYGDAVFPVKHLHTREEMADWCKNGSGAAICNYEKLIPGVMDEIRYVDGLICDESSLLKTGGGVIKWNLIKSAKGIEYKLSCTATPAPNDIMEYASQASFLEKLRNEGEILWTYFNRDKHGVWKVKPHALNAFFRFMAGWSIYLRNPSIYGWTDNLKSVPPPEIIEYEVPATPEQLELAIDYQRAQGGDLFGLEKLGVTARTKLSQMAKGFVYDTDKTPIEVDSLKPEFVYKLIVKDALEGRQVLVWTVFDEESTILADALADDPITVHTLTGSMKQERRLQVLEEFRRGECQVLISKASLLGYGMNFQNCTSMVFSGWNDSYEQWYQAIRRAYRYGQTKSVRVHVPFIPELEGKILENVLSKKARFEEETAIQERNYLHAMKGLITP